MKKRIIIAVVVLLILVIVALTFFRSTPFHYSGVAEAVSVDISARLSDTIQEILVEEGSPVTQGQVVARLTCDAANLKKEITQTEFNRAAQLLKTTAGSRENYDLKKHQYDEAALQQSWCTLTSPLTGQVLYKYYEPNEFISAGKKILTVANLKELDVWVYVPYEELAHLSIGQEVSGYLPEAAQLTDELAFFGLIRTTMMKKVNPNPKLKDWKTLLDTLVSQAVITAKPIDIFAAAGMEKPNLSLVDEQFLDKIKQMPQKNLAAELLKRLLDGKIKSQFKLNLPQLRKFSEKLKETVNKYNNGSLQTSQVIEELLKLAKEMNAAVKQGEDLGLSEKELAFYNALEENESAVRELGDDILKQIAQELTDYLRKSVKVDWSKRESVRAQIMLHVKRILRKYNYPPDQQQAATERVLEQAELISDELVK